MSVMSQGMRHGDTESPECNSAFFQLFVGKPGWMVKPDGRIWMPVLWATVAFETPVGDLFGLTEEDVKLLYADDPMVFTHCHKSWNPAQLLCMQPVTTGRMSLLRYFSVCNPQAMANSNPSLLHVACEHGEGTREFLQLLLQIRSPEATMMNGEEPGSRESPLAKLCARSDGCNAPFIASLLEVDSSVEVVYDGIYASIYHSDFASLMEKVDMLLKANPEAAKLHPFGGSCNLLHLICDRFRNSASRGNGEVTPWTLCIELMKRILEVHPKEFALKDVSVNYEEPEEDGELPVHAVARQCAIEVMEFLLDLYPESARSYTIIKSNNLLHIAASANVDKDVKVRYLCSRYPEVSLYHSSPFILHLHLIFVCLCLPLTAYPSSKQWRGNSPSYST